jgi:hypothetical protein
MYMLEYQGESVVPSVRLSPGLKMVLVDLQHGSRRGGKGAAELRVGASVCESIALLGLAAQPRFLIGQQRKLLRTSPQQSPGPIAS